MLDIMLVDNEAAILNGLAHCMDWEAHGCRIAAAVRDGAEAVRLLQTNPPDIVISDIRMPGMDGLALAEWIMRNTPQVKVILLTGFPDFDYAKQAINYRVVDFVLKPSTEEKLVQAIGKARALLDSEDDHTRTKRRLEDQTQKSLLLQQNLLLYDLLYHANLSMVYTLNRISALGLRLFCYYVIRFGISSSAPESEYAHYVQQAQDILRQCFPGQALYFVPKGDRFCYAVLDLPDEAGSDPAVESCCRKAVSEAGEQAAFLLTIGVSERQTDPLAMQRAAWQADQAQQFAEDSLQLPIMRFDELPTLSQEAWQTVIEELKLLESALERQNRAGAEQTLTRLFRFVRLQKMTADSVRRICSIIFNFCIGILFSYNRSDTLAGDRPLSLDALLNGGSLDETEARLRAFIGEVFDSISMNPTNIDSIIFSIKRYVDQNYAEELSLESLAAQVHLSPSYLSKLFKREIGQNLSVYILSVRIEHAKLLLRSTNMKTYEIAEAVGIGDPVYFSKLFKKTVGCKPKEYRLDGAGAAGQ